MRVDVFAMEPVSLPDAHVALAHFELPYAVREAILPPSLHPNTPPILTVLAWHCPASPWGAFSLAQLRVGCRSGVRTRGLLLDAGIDNHDAAAALAAGWGLATHSAEVHLRRGYDASTVTVDFDGASVLRLHLADPDPLGLDDVQLSPTLTPAEMPRGLRLVQFEPEYAVTRSERLRPRLDHLDPGAWGEARATPRHPVGASLVAATITLAPVRFVVRADVTGFDGTEPA